MLRLNFGVTKEVVSVFNLDLEVSEYTESNTRVIKQHVMHTPPGR